jgi:hypothetical protein
VPTLRCRAWGGWWCGLENGIWTCWTKNENQNNFSWRREKIWYLYSMKDNFDKLFNVVLVLTVFSVILSVIVVYKAVSIL